MAMLTRFLNRGSPSLLCRGVDFLQQPQSQSQSLRRLSSARSDDELREPCEFLGSWSPPSDPRIARANLERLRRAYGKQVKQMRKEYIYEMEMLRIEKQRKADARREAMRIENEERKKAKAAAAETRAAEHKAFQKEFRKTLRKERAEKLESWRKKEETNQKNKAAEREQLRLKSSLWVGEENLQQKIFKAIVDTQPL